MLGRGKRELPLNTKGEKKSVKRKNKNEINEKGIRKTK